MIKISATVHTCSPEMMASTATLPSGAVVQAQVKGLVVELVSGDGSTYPTIRIIPDNYGMSFDDAQALFAPGAAIDVSFAAHAD